MFYFKTLENMCIPVYSLLIIQVLIKLSKPLFPYLRKTLFVFIQTETKLLVFDTSLKFYSKCRCN